jgi:hypothetical protein
VLIHLGSDGRRGYAYGEENTIGPILGTMQDMDDVDRCGADAIEDQVVSVRPDPDPPALVSADEGEPKRRIG